MQQDSCRLQAALQAITYADSRQPGACCEPRMGRLTTAAEAHSVQLLPAACSPALALLAARGPASTCCCWRGCLRRRAAGPVAVLQLACHKKC